MRVLVTAGNTHTPVDRVRVLTNVFSGRTGAAVAAEFHRRGHAVTLLTSQPETAGGVLGRPPGRAGPEGTVPHDARATRTLHASAASALLRAGRSAVRPPCAEAGRMIDPHTGIGLAAARRAALPPGVPVVTLATAHPAKFRDAVERATGMRPPLPSRLGDLFEREERYVTLPATYEAVSGWIAARATPSR